MKLCIIFFMFFFTSVSARAERYTPTNPDAVIAIWSVISSPELQQAQTAKRLHPSDPEAVASLANNYLVLANKPGQSRLYGLAQAALKPLIESNTDNTQIWLAWAQVLQHQHAFDESLAAITKVLAREPKNINANLLAARIYLIQEKPAQARQSCLKLLGYSDLLTTSTCVLEITSHQQDALVPSYEQLQDMTAREGFPSDERGSWLAQVLADMALRLNNPKAAEEWLVPQLKNASVNLLAQWADTQIAQQHYKQVIDYLTPIVTDASEVDDLLLLQLALAEKTLYEKPHAEKNLAEKTGAEKNLEKSSQKFQTKWQQQLAERVSLREKRNDSQHANELARYYLDVSLQPQKALHWAEVHWQNSREYNDKKLLERAQAFASPSNSSAKAVEAI